MKGLLKIFFTGMLVSFLGTLPLGTLNMAAMQIAITESVRNALLFALGALTAEMFYVRLSLVAMDWVRRQEKIFKILEWLTLAIVLVLAISSFYTALHPAQHKNIILNSNLPSYVLGLLMSAINPVQIPFWFGWSTVLFTRKILLPQPRYYNFYIAGIGLGTFLGNGIFIFGGRLLVSKIQSHESVLHYAIGIIFTITALVQLWRMFVQKKDIETALEATIEVEKKLHDEHVNG